jgi:hypothetical protein
MALKRSDDVAALVLLSGYCYPVRRAKAITSGVPFASEILRQTVVPFVRRLMAPDTVRRVFAPCAVPERFKRAYPLP